MRLTASRDSRFVCNIQEMFFIIGNLYLRGNACKLLSLFSMEDGFGETN